MSAQQGRVVLFPFYQALEWMVRALEMDCPPGEIKRDAFMRELTEDGRFQELVKSRGG